MLVGYVDTFWWAGLESEWMAKRYLAQAALNKDENLLNFSLIETDRPVHMPRRTGSLEVEIEGVGEMAEFPNDMRQRCEVAEDLMRCRISGSHTPFHPDEMATEYLASSVAVPAMHPRITDLAKVITVEGDTDLEKLTADLKLLLENGYSRTTDADPGPGVYNLTSGGSSDAFVWKLDGEGQFWRDALNDILAKELSARLHRAHEVPGTHDNVEGIEGNGFRA